MRAIDDVVHLILLGAHLAEHDRIDDFEMRGIGGEREMHLVVVEVAIRRRAEMIFDVARAFDIVGREGAALEFVEDGAVRLAHHLAEHIEPAAMRHAEHDLLHAQGAAALDDLLERRHHGFAAVEAEALGARVAQIEEFLEAFRLDELVQDRALAFAGEADLLAGAFDALLEPGFFRRIGNMHEFEADRAAIGAPQDRQHLADRREFEAQAPCR